ncbi:Ltp family lipoprotein [Knoellia locipacati]|uniref:Ltp family lipoprotein n=1 Tax=Knoellia locipacati TaxID=882824 RepID=UPI00384BA5F8
MSNAPAGWYPQEDGRQRYWDGERWTEHFAPGIKQSPTTEGMPSEQSYIGASTEPVNSAGQAQTSAAPRPWFRKKRFIIPAGLVALVIMFSALSGSGEGDPVEASGVDGTPTATAPASPTSTAPSATPTAPAAATVAAPAPTTPPPAPKKQATVAPVAPVEPELSTAQEMAVRQAESYLDYAGFSKKGLIKQLEFEGFSAKDAQVAIGTLTVDWNAEAAESAKGYTEMSGFSRSSLIRQLEFEGYTNAQAKHGADSVGL